MVAVVWDMVLLNVVPLSAQGVLRTYLYHNERKIVLDLN